MNDDKGAETALAHRQYYGDMMNDQSAYGSIGYDYIPHGHDQYYSQPQGQLTGHYDQGYDAMLFLPLGIMLALLFCVCCFLANAFVGTSCYFFGKYDDEKDHDHRVQGYAKEYGPDAVQDVE